jgi:succinylglutamate desuccinylase
LPPESAAPLNFYVAQEIVKRSAAFHMEIDADTMNFTPFGAGALIATDGALTTHAGLTTEYLVFPNPRVLVGQRAGLMLVRDDVEAGSPHGQQ